MVMHIMVTMVVLIGDGIIRGVMHMVAIARIPMDIITDIIMATTMGIIMAIMTSLMATIIIMGIIMAITTEIIQRIMDIISTDRVQDLALGQDMVDIMWAGIR
jgi:hypothetical protein